MKVFKLQKPSETLTEENEGFVKEIIQDKYGQISPIKDSDIANNPWNPKTQRTGVIAKNIGKYPLWKKDGSKIYCTLLQVITYLLFFLSILYHSVFLTQVLDNHVVRYVPPEDYTRSVMGQKRLKHKRPLGCLVVGAEATDPQKVNIKAKNFL